MATTINSGYASSPKLTANIADHADVYGGRALVFDGVTDYLEIQDTLESVFQASYSISLWLKADDGQPSSNQSLFGVRTSANGSINNVVRSMITTNGKLFFTYQDGLNDAPAETYSAVFSDGATDWTHVAIVVSESADQIYIYVNGSVQTLHPTYNGNTSALTFSNFGTSNNFPIGGRNNLGTVGEFFNGKMCDFKIFNSAITEAQVQKLYKKPENTPSAVQDNLVAWYPMIEGNPESPQSIVYDHSEKGLGGELVANGNFETNVSGWIDGRGSDPETTLETSTIGGRNALKYQDANTSERAHFFYNNTDFTDGKLYKATFYAYKKQSGSTAKTFYFGVNETDLGNGSIGNLLEVSEWDTWEYFTTYYVAGTSGNAVAFMPTVRNNSQIGELYLDEVSVKEVLMGNHATTNFFGDELIENGGFESDGANWTNIGTPTISEVNTTGTYVNSGSKSWKITTDGYQEGIYQDLGSDEYESGKTYTAEAYVYLVDSITVELFINAQQIATTTTTGSFVKLSGTFVGSGSNRTLTVRTTSGSSNGTYYIDDVSVKEVGVSSSGFETAVNEPVVPQIPLMRYNQKMFFDGSDGYVQLPTPLSSTNHTISAWYVANSGDKYILDARDNSSDGITLALQANGTIWYAVRGSGGNSVTSSSGSFNVLNHVVVTYNGSTAKIYLNGVEVGSGTFTDTISTTTNARIGKISYANSGYFDGVIHEVAFYNKDFTQAEAQELFNDGVALDATTHSKKGNLLGYWRNDGVTTWQDRRGWSALTFDNTDYIDCGTAIGDSLGDSYSNDLTLSVWFKLASTGTTRGIFQIGDFAGAYGPFNLFYSSAGALYFRLNGNAWTRTATFSDLGWNHVAVIYDANSQSDSKIYLNGVSVSSSLSGVFPNSLDFNSKKTILGSILSASHPYNWEGDIKSIGLYNVAKSQSEIEAIYNAGINSSEASNSGIINYWELNNASTVKDLVGSSDGTINGTLVLNDGNDGDVQGSPDSITIREGLNSNRDGLGFYFTNPSSNVLRLNGVDEYVVAPDTDLSLSEQITIECWAKNNSDDLATDEYLVSQYETTSGANRSWLFRMLSDEKLRVVWSSNGTNYSLTATSSAITNVDTWRHYVTTIASGVAKIYVDGVAQTIDSVYSSGGLQTSLHNTISNIFVGRIANDNNTNWNGLIDEVKIYNRALSADEINKNYKHQKGKHKND